MNECEVQFSCRTNQYDLEAFSNMHFYQKK